MNVHDQIHTRTPHRSPGRLATMPSPDPPPEDIAFSEPPPLLVSGLGVSLGGMVVLEGVDAEVAAGERWWLQGANGAGKSTLLSCIIGAVEAGSGQVEVFGLPPARLEARSRIGYLPDEPPLYDDLTLEEQAVLLPRLRGKPETTEAVLDWYRRFGLGERLEGYPGALSRGMRQKAALSVLLGVAPPLLLLDEPLNALDAEAQVLLLQGLKEHAEAGGAVVLSGHQLDLDQSWDGGRWLLQGGRLDVAAAPTAGATG